MKNKTLTNNMPNVKWQAIPPVRGPNPQGITRSKNGKKNNSKKKKHIIIDESEVKKKMAR